MQLISDLDLNDLQINETVYDSYNRPGRILDKTAVNLKISIDYGYGKPHCKIYSNAEFVQQFTLFRREKSINDVKSNKIKKRDKTEPPAAHQRTLFR